MCQDPLFEDLSVEKRVHMVTSFIEEEAFYILSLYDKLNFIDPSILFNILPESVSLVPHYLSQHSKNMTKIMKHEKTADYLATLEKYRNAERFKSTYSYYRENLRTIEIHWAGRCLSLRYA